MKPLYSLQIYLGVAITYMAAIVPHVESLKTTFVKYFGYVILIGFVVITIINSYYEFHETH